MRKKTYLQWQTLRLGSQIITNLVAQVGLNLQPIVKNRLGIVQCEGQILGIYLKIYCDGKKFAVSCHDGNTDALEGERCVRCNLDIQANLRQTIPQNGSLINIPNDQW